MVHLCGYEVEKDTLAGQHMAISSDVVVCMGDEGMALATKRGRMSKRTIWSTECFGVMSVLVVDC